MPDGKVVPAFYVNEYPDWTNALALTKEGKVLMVKQYRHGIGEESYEVPGGVVDDGESPEEAISRELLEETGYQFEKIEYLARVSANASTTNNYTHFYLATGGEKVRDQKLDDLEELEVMEISIDELKQWIKDNKMVQSLHVNCVMYGLLKLGELQL